MPTAVAMIQIAILGTRWDIEWWMFLLTILAPIFLVCVADRRIRARR